MDLLSLFSVFVLLLLRVVCMETKFEINKLSDSYERENCLTIKVPSFYCFFYYCRVCIFTKLMSIITFLNIYNTSLNFILCKMRRIWRQSYISNNNDSYTIKYFCIWNKSVFYIVCLHGVIITLICTSFCHLILYFRTHVHLLTASLKMCCFLINRSVWSEI